MTVTRAGAVVMPAAPGFYHRPDAIDELVDFMVRACSTTSTSPSRSLRAGNG